MSSTIPAAQYLRMSSEDQRYSLKNQAAAILEFADHHGFHIVKNYSDPARSGLTLARRQGLRTLLGDIASGNNEYRAILAYDVSRWGRFQDVDESAHYEFLCRSAGVAVRYCAEGFDNNGSLAGNLMKALKRCMAAEFSRELGVRVYEGKRRIVERGFNVGGRAPFGLRRQIVSDHPERCRVLETGERKYDRSERLILVPGPTHEVNCIREIFHSVLEHGLSPREIARALNAKGVTFRQKRWNQNIVHGILTNPLYAGFSVWARTSQRLGSGRVAMPEDRWAKKADCFAPVVQPAEFQRVQSLMRLEFGRTYWTRNRILEAAKRVLSENGKLTYAAFDATPGAPKWHSVQKFGQSELCREIGYQLPQTLSRAIANIKATLRLRHELITALRDRFPNELALSTGPRPQLVLDGSVPISLVMCRQLEKAEAERWGLRITSRNKDSVTIVCCLNRENTAPHALFVFPFIPLSGRRRQFGNETPWVKSGVQVHDLSQLCILLRAAAQNREHELHSTTGME